jgi:hypothetical protein
MLLSLSLSLLLPLLSNASSHGVSHLNSKRHADLAHKVVRTEPAPAPYWNETGGLHKRGSCTNARATWYDVGLGACGQTDGPGDDIIALTVQMYGNGYPGPQCFKGVTIECNGKTHNAVIKDECMGCPYCGIDMSTGLFQKFAGLGAGVLSCNWWFNDGSGPANPPAPPAPKPDPPKPKPAPPPTPPKQEVHTPTVAPPKPPPPPPPPKSTPHSTSHSQSHSAPHSSASPSSSSPPPVQSQAGPENIKDMFQALIGMGRVVADANN